jgi:hypothetical protein
MFLLEYIKVKLRIRVKLFSLESVEEALHYNISFLLVLSFLLLSLFNCKLTLFYQLYSWSLPWSPLFYFSKSAFICFMILFVSCQIIIFDLAVWDCSSGCGLKCFLSRNALKWFFFKKIIFDISTYKQFEKIKKIIFFK